MSSIPSDWENALLSGHSPLNKLEAASKINEFAKSAGLASTHLNELLALINSLFPTANLPAHRTAAGTLLSTIDKYVGANEQARLLTFDCCPCGRTVYVKDKFCLDQCPEPSCAKLRFTPCRRVDCGALGMCSHLEERTPVKVIHYKPFISIVEELLRTKGFLSVMNYEFADRQPGQYRDVSDGTEYKKQMEEMHNRFLLEADKSHQQFSSSCCNATTNNSSELIELSLAVEVTYDGTMLFKRRHAKFSPLVATILNLPFNYRSVVGAGMFMLGICAFSSGKWI